MACRRLFDSQRAAQAQYAAALEKANLQRKELEGQMKLSNESDRNFLSNQLAASDSERNRLAAANLELEHQA